MSQSPNPAGPQPVAPLLALATQFLRAGRPADAIAPLHDAALLQPSNPSIQHDLGLACLEVDRIPDAIAAFERAVASNPSYTDAYFRLGIALEKLGNIGRAIAAYDRATELDPALTEAWFRAGALVYILGHRDEAIGCFRRAAATGGNTGFGRLGKARALLTEDRNEEAELVLRKTLSLDPGNALAHDLLGNLLSEFGRFDEARECFERAIRIAPLMAGSYYELVRCAWPQARTTICFHGWKPPWPRQGWKRRKACGCTSRSAKRRRILAISPWPCSISTPRTQCAGHLRPSTRRRSPARSTA